MPLFPFTDELLRSDPPMRYWYGIIALSQSPLFHIFPLYRKSYVLPHISVLPQNTCFIVNHHITVNRPFITFITIAPLHYRFVAYRWSLADAILLSHRPIIALLHYRSFTSSLFYIIVIPYRNRSSRNH